MTKEGRKEENKRRKENMTRGQIGEIRRGGNKRTGQGFGNIPTGWSLLTGPFMRTC